MGMGTNHYGQLGVNSEDGIFITSSRYLVLLGSHFMIQMGRYALSTVVQN